MTNKWYFNAPRDALGCHEIDDDHSFKILFGRALDQVITYWGGEIRIERQQIEDGTYYTLTSWSNKHKVEVSVVFGAHLLLRSEMLAFLYGLRFGLS